MPVQLTIQGRLMKFPTPFSAISHAVPVLNRADGGVDPLALAHATCVATAHATRTNTANGRRAMTALAKMVEAFEQGDTERAIQYAVALGIDSVVLNSAKAGVSHPATCAAFQKAYEAKSLTVPETVEPKADDKVSDPEPDVDSEIDPIDDLDDGDDDDNDWADEDG